MGGWGGGCFQLAWINNKKNLWDWNTCLEVVTCIPSISTMGHLKFIISSQMEESISIQRVKNTENVLDVFLNRLHTCRNKGNIEVNPSYSD